MDQPLHPHIGYSLDLLHVILITGLVSFIASLSTHVITKYKLSGKYVPTKEFYDAIVALKEDRTEVFAKVFDHCELMRAKCPFGELVEDIKEIKDVQKRRTAELAEKARKDTAIWRIIMTKLAVPVEEQNRLLLGG